MRLLTRRGHDWAYRYPLISEAARRLKPTSFVLDGEAVWLHQDGRSDFDKLHSRKHDGEIRLAAFDLLAVGGRDIRSEPLQARKALLEMLLAKPDGDGIPLVEHLDGEVGAATFAQACEMGLEGIVSKRLDRPYRAGRSPDWRKVKNRTYPAMTRVLDVRA